MLEMTAEALELAIQNIAFGFEHYATENQGAGRLNFQLLAHDEIVTRKTRGSREKL